MPESPKSHAHIPLLLPPQNSRRRMGQILQKIRAIVRLLRSRMMAESTQDCIIALIEDFEHIAVNMEDAGCRLESMLPIVTSLVQIDNAPGHKYFWVYFVIAVSVTAVVYLIARPPSKELKILFEKFKLGRKRLDTV
ncbi:hypothetical protein V2W45_1452725, partial [Cenococcum geophilum]